MTAPAIFDADRFDTLAAWAAISAVWTFCVAALFQQLCDVMRLIKHLDNAGAAIARYVCFAFVGFNGLLLLRGQLLFSERRFIELSCGVQKCIGVGSRNGWYCSKVTLDRFIKSAFGMPRPRQDR